MSKQRLLTFTIFDKQNAGPGQVICTSVEWDDIVAALTPHKIVKEDTDKALERHFNGVYYSDLEPGIKARRNSLAETADLLTLDFDNIVTLEEAMDMYREYTYLIYSSFNHQRWKYDKSTGSWMTPRDKFRVVFPLAQTVSKQEWLDRVFDKALKYLPADAWEINTFAPHVDGVSKVLSQPFCIPIQHPDEGEAFVQVNEGKLLNILDWKKVDRSEATKSIAKNNNPTTVADGYFPVDQQFRLESGAVVTVETLNVGDTEVCCPFHGGPNGESTPSSGVRKNVDGFATHYCFVCNNGDGQLRLMERERNDSPTTITFKSKSGAVKNLKAAITPVRITSAKVDLECDAQPAKPFNREERAALLKKKCFELKHRTLLYAFEGFGKSHLATMLVTQKKEHILFACNSNDQVDEQARGFAKFRYNGKTEQRFDEDGNIVRKEYGQRLLVQKIVSVAYRLEKEYNFEVIRGKPQHPWDTEAVDKEASIMKLLSERPDLAECEPEAMELWDSLSPDKPDFENFDIVVTTHARIGSWGQRQADAECPMFVRKDVIIMFDDPEQSAFRRLMPIGDWSVNLTINDKLLEIEEIANKRYFIRPEQFVVGYGYDSNKMVFTTTELVTSHLISTEFPDIDIPNLMPEEKMIAGSITMIKTHFVAASRDGFIPVMVERVKRETGREIEYFADGQGNEYNLTNNKGQNRFKTMDTIVEISQPTPVAVTDLLNELGWEWEMMDLVKNIISIDKMNQAIGRNSGYRWSDGEQTAQCVVLCDTRMFNSVVEGTRYHIERTVDINEYSGDYRKRKGEGIVDWLKWMMQNHDAYMVRGVRSRRPFQDWMADAKAALLAAGNVVQRLKRLEVALTNRIEEMEMNERISDRKTEQMVALMNQIVDFGSQGIGEIH